MKKTFICCMTVILGLSSCDKLYENIFSHSYQDVTDVVSITLDNKTEQEFFCDISIRTVDSSEIQSCKISQSSTSKLIFNKTKNVRMDKPYFYYAFETDVNLYNLSDTAHISLILSLLLREDEQGWIQVDKNDAMGVLRSHIITVSNEKLSLFEKDYSMLEKFPEYYGN